MGVLARVEYGITLGTYVAEYGIVEGQAREWDIEAGGDKEKVTSDQSEHIYNRQTLPNYTEK